MTDTTDSTYQNLVKHAVQTNMLGSISSMLWWDERTQMPAAGSAYRAEQVTLLSGMMHQRRTDPRVGEWLAELSDSPLAEDPHSDSGTVIRQLKRTFDKQTSLPQSLVEEIARQGVLGQHVWQEAREKDDFASFAVVLEKLIDLARQKADALGFPECRYDALLDEYEPHEVTSNVTRVLGDLRKDLVPLVQEIVDSGKSPNVDLLRGDYPVAAQSVFGREAATRIGFDFDRGRLDETVHPFCSEMGPHDVRMTTRYDASFFPSAFFSILHEAGHGIYQQGLRVDQFGLPPGEYTSLGIHESQSRLWENQVGRSRSFWQYFLPRAAELFPSALAGVKLDDFYFAVNDVRPSLIRVEADEATYNLHILIRFELEQALIEGDLPVADLPAAWNEKYQEYLGLTPPDYTQGVLQDIHWSSGSFGYFPTYSLGNLYAAQLFDAAGQQHGDLESSFAGGDFQPMLSWLRTTIHEPGQRYGAAELAQRATGQPLSHRPLIDYLRGKLGPLYGL